MAKTTYQISVIEDESVWEDFQENIKPHTFLQSWKWGEQNELLGSKIFRLGIFNKDNILIATSLIIRVKAKRGSFLLCPHGPQFKDDTIKADVISQLTKYCIKLGKSEKCDFIRFCPTLEDSEQNQLIFKRNGFIKAPIHMHTELSWLLDITKPEEELLADMRKTTRYLIRHSEKDNISISISQDPKDMKVFWPIYKDTADRQNFTPFSKEYLQREFELFSKDNQIAFFFGSHQGEVITAAIIIFYAGSGFYHHSGSLKKFEKLNSSYLLQWKVIQEAKQRNCQLYNFWGIAPDNKPKHPWLGLSQFKKGFGGFSEAYLHAQDKPLTYKYLFNYIIETIRRIKRGF